MSQEPLVWERVEWRQGDGRYRFEVAQGGLHATLTAPHGASLTLPMVARCARRLPQDQDAGPAGLSRPLRRPLV